MGVGLAVSPFQILVGRRCLMLDGRRLDAGFGFDSSTAGSGVVDWFLSRTSLQKSGALPAIVSLYRWAPRTDGALDDERTTFPSGEMVFDIDARYLD